MTDRNDDLAYSTLDYIREHPEEWDQRDYFCGSTACFAGRAILLAGGQAVHGRSFITARDLLGWTYDEAHYIFNSFTRDFDVLELAVKRVLNGEISPGRETT